MLTIDPVAVAVMTATLDALTVRTADDAVTFNAMYERLLRDAAARFALPAHLIEPPAIPPESLQELHQWAAEGRS